MKNTTTFFMCFVIAFSAITPSIAFSTVPTNISQGEIPIGGTLRCGPVIRELSHLNQYLYLGNWVTIWQYVYEKLLFFNPVNGSYCPWLATDYEWSSDGLSLTFHLRTDVTWHDGEKFTSEDVKYTFTILRDYSDLDIYKIWDYVSEIQTPDDYTVIFKLKEPFTPLLSYVSNSYYIVPKHIWKNVDPTNFTNLENPIGSGAFKYVKTTERVSTELEPNPDWWGWDVVGHGPYIDKLLIIWYTGTPPSTGDLVKKEIDYNLGGIAMPTVPKMREDPEIFIQKYPDSANWVICLNNKKYPLSLKEVRYAIALAWNKSETIEKGSYGLDLDPNPGWISPVFGDYYNVTLALKHSELVTGNQTKAIEILESLGFVRGDDGIFVTPNGTRLSFTYYLPAMAPGQWTWAMIITGNLKKIGIETKIMMASWGELPVIGKKGEFDILQVNYGPYGQSDPDAVLYPYLHSSMTAPIGELAPGYNFIRYNNTHLDELLDKARTVVDLEERKKLYSEIQQILIEDVPSVINNHGAGHIPYTNHTFEGWRTDMPVHSVWSIVNVHLHPKAPTPPSPVTTWVYGAIVAVVVIVIVAVVVVRRKLSAR